MHFLRFPPDNEDRRSSTQAFAQEERRVEEPDDALALARAIHGAGLSSMAVFALDVLKPLHWLGGQALWLVQPFVDSLGVGMRRSSGARNPSALSVDGVARLLEREDGLDDLAASLERLQVEHKSGKGS